MGLGLPLQDASGVLSGPLAQPFHFLFPQHVPTVQRNQTANLRVPVHLRLLGYMDTLVHFGGFGLAGLRKTEIDSCPPDNLSCPPDNYRGEGWAGFHFTNYGGWGCLPKTSKRPKSRNWRSVGQARLSSLSASL
ncbi:hypothetical protein, partial [Paracoccus yeei]|uniref:hypothetical protein n=1 Tax=Paracoccus yeei TaxID=147645 RepID=UPI001B80A556